MYKIIKVGYRILSKKSENDINHGGVMVTCFDVAKYILTKMGKLTTVKLQKLVYYAQAWSLVWDDAPLFDERIEAWLNGPIVPDLYNLHRGKFSLKAEDLPSGNENNLTKNQKKSINIVLKDYGNKSSQWLSELTHLEEPWKKARKGLSPNERGNNEITLDSMAEYYTSILPE